VLLAAALGGIVSSTAVTIANARRALAREGESHLLAAAVAVGSAVMFLRVIAIVAALKPALLMLIAPTLLSATVVAGGVAIVWVYWRQAGTGQCEAVSFRNPLGFMSVVGFAVFLGAIMVLGRAVGETLGATAAIIGAVVVGAADADAATVSMARLTPEALTAEQAAFAILAGVASATVSKIGVSAQSSDAAGSLPKSL
jgi:uncharacterized membrane protein (DUF4010 family)